MPYATTWTLASAAPMDHHALSRRISYKICMTMKAATLDIGDLLREAVGAQQSGRLREAEKLYTRILKVAPQQFDALNLLGTVKAQQGQIGEAQRLFSAAVKANPRAPQGWSNLGQALHALRRSAEALECFDKAQALAPDDINTLYQRGNVLLSLNAPPMRWPNSRRCWSACRSILRRGSIAGCAKPRSARPNWRSRNSMPRLRSRPTIRTRITIAASP